MNFIAGYILLGNESQGHEYGGSQKHDSVEVSKSGGMTSQNLSAILSGKQVKEPPVGLRVQLSLLYLLEEERFDRVG